MTHRFTYQAQVLGTGKVNKIYQKKSDKINKFNKN